MTEFKIEEGIDLFSVSREGVTKYPWPVMKDGDSFFVAGEDATQGISNSGNSWCERHKPDHYVTQRTVDGGIRVWMFKEEGEE